VPQIIFGHDLMLALDGGWKWHWGIRPHVDYYSPSGVVSYLLIDLGLRVSGGMAQALPAAICLFAALLLPASLYVSFSRMPPPIAAMTTLVMIAAVLAPHQLRFPSHAFTYATIYNRWGYGLLCVALLAITSSSLRSSKAKETVDGALAATCVLILLFLKISFGVLAILLFVSWLFVRRRLTEYYLAAVVAGGIWLAIFGFLLHWNFGNFGADMLIALGAREGLKIAGVFESAVFLYPEICLLVVLAFLWCVRGGWGLGQSLRRRLLEGSLFLGCYAGLASAVILTNSPLGNLRESPLLSVAALFFLGGIFARIEEGEPSPKAGLELKARILPGLVVVLLSLLLCFGFLLKANRTGLMSLALLAGGWWVTTLLRKDASRLYPPLSRSFAVVTALLIFFPVLGRNATSMAQAGIWKLQEKSFPSDQVFADGPLAGIMIKAFGGDPPLPTTYVGKVYEGLALLEATGNSRTTVNALEFSNPFNVVRGVRPSRTGPTAWQLHILYSCEIAPPPERVFSQGEPVLLPKQFGDADQRNIEALFNHYGEYLHRHFHPPIDSEQWWLYIPKDNSPYHATVSANAALSSPD